MEKKTDKNKITLKDEIQDNKVDKKKDKEKTEYNNNDEEIFLLEIEKSSYKKVNKKKIYTFLSRLLIIVFFVFVALFIYEVWILPMRIDNSIGKAQDLYNKDVPNALAEDNESEEEFAEIPDADNEDDELIPFDPNRDKSGRLLQFEDLLSANEDVKGYITIPNTNIDLPIVQSSNGDPEYYLTRGWDGQPIKSGSLFLDNRSSVENNSQNLVIHGHNMKSTDNMFHHLLRYGDINFMKENPVFTFDTIYRTGEWKIFAYIITNGSARKEEFFDYQKSTFSDGLDFMNFVYQLRIRSKYNFDDVDINEKDQIITLSTCSYELNDYRTLVIARKIREDEDPTVDPDSIRNNPKVLYPETFHSHYGVEVPELAETFEEALESDLINWYNIMD